MNGMENSVPVQIPFSQPPGEPSDNSDSHSSGNVLSKGRRDYRRRRFRTSLTLERDRQEELAYDQR